MFELNKKNTVHTARTIMFTELAKVMNHAVHEDRYIDALKENISNKQTKTNQKRTDSALLSIYKFDDNYIPFRCFKYFWQNVSENELPVITLLYTICHDYLLSESANVVLSIPLGKKVSKQKLADNIEIFNPQKFTENTRNSASRNLISSWKQVGYISGNNSATRIQCDHTYNTVAFAFLMSYLNGDRGDFILSSKWVKSLAIGESKTRELATEASIRDILQYQFAGSVSQISFKNLFQRMNINVEFS